jgi:L-fucose/D-arabinose isomerase
VPAEFVRYPQEEMLALGQTVTPEWPIAFTKLQCPAETFLESFPCNHIHGCYGDWTAELTHIAKCLKIPVKLFESRT